MAGIQVPPDSTGQVVETKDVSLGASNVERQVVAIPEGADKFDKLLKLAAMQVTLLHRLVDWAEGKDLEADIDELAEAANDILEEV